jgi:hypothetical protein
MLDEIFSFLIRLIFNGIEEDLMTNKCNKNNYLNNKIKIETELKKIPIIKENKELEDKIHITKENTKINKD